MHSIKILLIIDFNLAQRISERHYIIENSIGVFREEVASYETVSLLSWLLPVLVITAHLLDILLITGNKLKQHWLSLHMKLNICFPLFQVFHFWTHPWLVLLTHQAEEDTQKVEEELRLLLNKEVMVC